MEEEANSPGKLLDKVDDYARSGIELLKLKAIGKSSDVISSAIPHSIVIILISVFLTFLNFGVALGLGEILGKSFYGFFIVAAFYGGIVLIIHFFMHQWIKKIVRSYFIRLILK